MKIKDSTFNRDGRKVPVFVPEKGDDASVVASIFHETPGGLCISFPNDGLAPMLFLEWISNFAAGLCPVHYITWGAGRFFVRLDARLSTYEDCAAYINSNL